MYVLCVDLKSRQMESYVKQCLPQIPGNVIPFAGKSAQLNDKIRPRDKRVERKLIMYQFSFNIGTQLRP